ncbi:MAG: AsmA-like C-terminal domain-containing protein [Deltaproteobacteria bacterium]|nr:AsmA-like C-terminal domain-containing protein [Deltaproteobacteria bacterium]
MGRKYKIIPFVLLLTGLLVYVAPNLLSVKEIGARLVEQASSAMQAEIIVGRLHWNWDPLPHLTLVDTTVTHRDFNLRLPDSRIYPDWWALLAGRVNLGHLSLRSPDITLNPSFFSAAGGEAPPPLLNVTVEGGTLHTPSLTYDNITVKGQSFADINLKIRKKSGHLAVTWLARSSFAGLLSLQGKFFTESSSYSCTLETKKFRLSELIDSASTVIRPLAGGTDFNCDIIGDGKQNVQVLFSGGIPAFSLRRLENPVAFTFNQAKLLLEKNGPDLSARIFELGMIDPLVSFSGKVSRSLAPDSTTPLYRLELAARDIDLSGIRGKLLTLLGDEHITGTVCDIVRAGRAKSASYAFNGTLAEFANLSAMTIHVDVDQASIHVPEVDLDLERASGPIIIKDGVIHGYNLTSWLDSHFGSNGSFSLGLSDDNWLFKLDLDIDADLALLPQTLHHLIKNDGFGNEVGKFSAQGRKMGHLTIGDDLRDFTVDVQVPDMKDTEVNYERLIWPVTLQAGALHIHGDEIAWREVAAQAGPHVIREFSGKLSWADSSAVPFGVENFAGTLDAESLLTELNRYPWINEALAPHVSSLAGAISVSRAKAQGALLSPSSWGYELGAALENISCDTPYLPQTVTIAKGALALETKRVALSGAEVTFLDSPLTLATDLSHDRFSGWQGGLELTGPVTQAQGDWLAGKDWLPQPFFPKIPCELDKFKINFSGDDVTLLGALRNKSPAGLPVTAGLDVRIRDGRHERSSFHFAGGEKEGLITMTGDYSLSFPEIAFQGSIDWQTVTTVFNSQTLLGGELHGEFTLTPPGPDQEGFTFTGLAEAHDLQWLWGNLARPVSIASLSLQGDGEHLAINDLLFTFENETVSSSGELSFYPRHIETDLTLRAETLSQNTLSHFIEDLNVSLDSIGSSGNRLSTFSKKITGGIDIEAKEFSFAETIKEGKSESYKLTPLQGRIDFTGQGATTLLLTDSGFCGLAIDGTLTWQGEQSSKEFILKNPDGSPALFDDFLPCAGVKKRFLSGPFSVNATLTDANGTLSAGKFDLKGEEGVLEKMEILSKIFKLINITDYYQGLFSGGFRYKMMEIHGHVADNLLILDKAVMEGEGMDVMAQGNINLHSLEMDLTFFIVPFKSLDKIINMVPLVGRIVGGKKRHIVTYPLRVTGKLKEPDITVLSPTAIGKAAIDFIFDTITFPLDILPLPEGEK